MRHPNETEWSDYVRGSADSETVRSLEEHLAGGCDRCEQEVQALETVYRVGLAEQDVEVPASALKSVHNLFRVQQLIASGAKANAGLSLLFDSAMAPAPSGVRSQDAQTRHIVYRSAEATLDLQLQPSLGPERTLLTGQVLDSDSKPVSDVPTFLLHSGRVSAQSLSGRLGHFEMLFDSEASPRLCMLLGDGQLIDLELPALGKSAN